jgi:fumarate reductase flavoprotein subunit
MPESTLTRRAAQWCRARTAKALHMSARRRDEERNRGARVDVIVVGGGFSGLIVANRCAERGLEVTVLEQGAAEDYLCNSRIATGALNFAHSDPRLPVDRLVQAVMDDTGDHADPALARALAGVIAPTLDWLQAEGAEFHERTVQDKRTVLLAPVRSFSPGLDWRNNGADRLLQRLTANLRRRGGELKLAARATSLIVENGRCTGVQAETADGPRRFAARHVVLADGGFQGNPDLVRRHICRHPEALVQRSAGTGRGDAINMAAAAGAKLVDMDSFYGHLLSRAARQNPRLWPYPTLDGLTGTGILIGPNGRRIFDEGLGGITLSNLIAGLDDPLSTAVVFDAAIWERAAHDEVVPVNPHLPNTGGEIYRADDLAALAGQIGVPADGLSETVATYNAAVRDDTLEALDPPRTPGRRFGIIRNSPDRLAPRAVEHPPYYAAPLAVGISVTLGGVAIDPGARALRPSGEPFDGLYAVGSTSGGIEGGPIAGYMGGLAKAICTATLAAQDIVARHAVR